MLAQLSEVASLEELYERFGEVDPQKVEMKPLSPPEMRKHSQQANEPLYAVVTGNPDQEPDITSSTTYTSDTTLEHTTQEDQPGTGQIVTNTVPSTTTVEVHTTTDPTFTILVPKEPTRRTLLENSYYSTSTSSLSLLPATDGTTTTPIPAPRATSTTLLPIMPTTYVTYKYTNTPERPLHTRYAPTTTTLSPKGYLYGQRRTTSYAGFSDILLSGYVCE